MRKAMLVSIAVLLLAAPAALAREGFDMLILTPEDLQIPAAVLARHRTRGGHKVLVQRVEDVALVAGEVSPERVRDFVRELYVTSGKNLRYLLIMGDAPAPDDPEGRVRIPPKILAPRYRDARFAHAKEIASDPWYGMVDDDLFPEVAVGRLPADSTVEASLWIKRIIDYETKQDFGPWRKRINVVAGTGRFGPLVDMFLEATFKKYMQELLPPAWDVTLTYANPRSPYCWPPPRFSEKVLEHVNEGSLMTAYVGHGAPHAFDTLRWAGQRYPILDRRAVGRLRVTAGSPILVVIACSTGHFDHPRGDSVSEVILRRPRGPVAVVSSTRISQPYANGILAREMILHFLDRKNPTLGSALLAVKRAMIEGESEDQKNLDRMAALLMGPDKLEPCRADHVHLYTLFGDPAMPIGTPRGAVKLDAPEAAAFGETIRVTGRIDRAMPGATVSVALVPQRGKPLSAYESVADQEGETLFETMKRNWKRANRSMLAKVEGRVRGRGFAVAITVPAGEFEPGDYVLKAYVEGERDAALGSTLIRLGGKAAPPDDEEEGF